MASFIRLSFVLPIWFATFPQSVLNLCFLCTMSLVAIHKPEANKIPVILKDVSLEFSEQRSVAALGYFDLLPLGLLCRGQPFCYCSKH